MFLQSTSPDTLNIVVSIILMIVAYICGSFPSGVVIGRAMTGTDIRQYGSKNTGSTNAIRVLGKKVGFLVFFCDVLKGAIVIIVLQILSACDVFHSVLDYGFYGMMAVIGHSFSIFLNFKGGKAVATSLGVVLCICPLAGVFCLITFLILLKSTGYVSLASTCATLAVLITYLVLFFIGYHGNSFLEYFISAPSLANLLTILVPGFIIVYKHIPNYKRLIAGTENCFKKKTKDERIEATIGEAIEPESENITTSE